MKILVAEPLAAAGIELLRAQAGWDVVVSNPKEYAAHLADCDALLVRSAVKVNKDVLAKAPKLRVVGRAGVGVDNVDLDASTAAGVLVMNTPGGNAISVAEHTIGLMLALARALPAASASTKAGKWEKKKFQGNELRGKTLGVLGLGSIGREVVKRAANFEMRIISHDPFVNPRTAADLNVELVSIDKLYAESDYISLHLALTPETHGVLNASAFAKMKPGVRIVNCARGELIKSADLVEAMNSGKVAGAGLDVFEKEPPEPSDPILAVENLLATPHIGGSTDEAQEIVGVRIVEQVVEYLAHGVAINAVNMPSLTPEMYKAVGPFIALAERLGNFAAYAATGNPKSVKLTYSGRIAELNTSLLRSAALAGVMNRSLEQRANLVNAMSIADERGLGVAEQQDKQRIGHVDSVKLSLETETGTTVVEGAVILGKPRLISVDGIYCEATLNGHLLFLKNHDVPGVIGHVGSVLGTSGINIANFSLGRQEDVPAGQLAIAIAVVEVDSVVPEDVLGRLKSNPAVLVARPVEVLA
ncbi:MAG: phosphoglycerate dehydrogenase [Acidobacteria bacterium]|nr:phosphoglycerate dehydrogenase [Acidobacteriota bacterium]